MLYEDEVDFADAETKLTNPELLDGFEYHPSHIELFDYDSDRLTEKEINDPVEATEFLNTESVTWVNVSGLENVQLLEDLRENFSVHPLVLEDILRPFQRPKFEIYDNYIFLINRYIEPDNLENIEQISFVLGDTFLLTFQETRGDLFDRVRTRIREGISRIRTSGPDYLTYELLDSIVDSYFPVLESIGDDLGDLEDEIMKEQLDEINMEDIHNYRRQLLILRRTAWSQREMLGQLQQKELEFVADKNQLYFRDAYDHAIRILDIIESYRDMSSSLQELHLSMSSNQMNAIMKVLTIIATIFIPLTFVAGIYGMNFNPETSPWNMPELNWYWGYPAVLVFMLLIAAVMLNYFHRRDWL